MYFIIFCDAFAIRKIECKKFSCSAIKIYNFIFSAYLKKIINIYLKLHFACSNVSSCGIYVCKVMKYNTVKNKCFVKHAPLSLFINYSCSFVNILSYIRGSMINKICMSLC